MVNSAILFMVFNRPEPTVQAFNAIRKAKPARLYVAADGPRGNKHGEQELCKEVRKIATSIDWECEVKTLFLEKNIGCKQSVYGAISWFFENEEMGIIIEDDILCDDSFFYFCDELLEKYKDDNRVGIISGNNHINCSPLNGDSYLFSKFKFTWGWASWRRAWNNMDIAMKWIETPYSTDIIKNMGYNKISQLHWRHNIDLVNNESVNTWDFQWFLSLSAQNQLCIFPKENLCANIGFGQDATHTISVNVPNEFKKANAITFPLKHPDYLLPNFEFEVLYEKKMITIMSIWVESFFARIKKDIKFFIRYKK